MNNIKNFLHLSFINYCSSVVVDGKSLVYICIVSLFGGAKELYNKSNIKKRLFN